MKNYQLLFLSITVALLTACGSGGSGSGSEKSSSQIATPNKPSKNLINDKETPKGNSENKPSSKPNNGEQENNPKNETGSEINNKKEQSGNQQGNSEDKPNSKPDEGNQQGNSKDKPSSKPDEGNQQDNSEDKPSSKPDESNQQGNPEDEPSSKPSDNVPDNLKQAVKKALEFKVDWEPVPNHSSVTIDKNSYNKGESFYLTDFGLGYSEHDFASSEDKEYIAEGKLRIYRLPYSVIVAATEEKVTALAPYNNNEDGVVGYGAGLYVGYLTKDLPETGTADYVGKSFYNDETGNLKLSVNFGEKAITSGEITGLSTGKVTFKRGNFEVVDYEDFADRDIETMGFKGEAMLANANSKLVQKYTKSATGDSVEFKERALSASNHHFRYEGHFFGPNAEEVAGDISVYEKKADGSKGDWIDSPINFAGQRGKIKKP